MLHRADEIKFVYDKNMLCIERTKPSDPDNENEDEDGALEPVTVSR